MLTVGRSYAIATFKGWAGEEKPVKDTEKKQSREVRECSKTSIL